MEDLNSCPACGAQDNTEIEIHLTGSDAVRFSSCRRCERRWWERGGGLIELGDVLEMAGAGRR